MIQFQLNRNFQSRKADSLLENVASPVHEKMPAAEAEQAFGGSVTVCLDDLTAFSLTVRRKNPLVASFRRLSVPR